MASLAKGGVAVYVKKSVLHGFADFSVPNIEFIPILVCTAEKPVMTSVVYRPPPQGTPQVYFAMHYK